MQMIDALATGRNSCAFPETIICLSHLRWDFVFQRPQHLMTRIARQATVYYIEEAVFDAPAPRYDCMEKASGLIVATPHLPYGLDAAAIAHAQQQLLDHLVEEMDMTRVALWYYTPMALTFSRHLKPALTVFDCMDELSAFKFAPRELLDLEAELLSRADVVFTGGSSLYAAKKNRHSNIHLFPSSIDRAHFGKARGGLAAPKEQEDIPHPRLGFFGVIDERFDIDLIDQVSAQRPDWQLVLVGPVVKIDPAMLPRRDNIHYPGGKSYAELPAWLAGWDIALIPFALNESTRFISPTKPPEYLAAGIPVISTPIRDVVHPYGDTGLVHIAANAETFITIATDILNDQENRAAWLKEVDAFLEGNSWDNTCAGMTQQMLHALNRHKTKTSVPAQPEIA